VDIADIIVPGWYLEAKGQSASPDELRAKVRDFCLQAFRAHALHDEEQEDLSDDVIDITIDMYEYALRKRA